MPSKLKQNVIENVDLHRDFIYVIEVVQRHHELTHFVVIIIIFVHVNR